MTMRLRTQSLFDPIRSRMMTSAHAPRLVFIGNYGNRNIGDDAILQILSARYRQAYPRHAQYVFARHHPHDLDRITEATPLSADMRSVRWVLRHVDTIVIGGGGLFGARMGPKARFIPILALVALLLGKRVIYESIGFYSNTAFVQRILLYLTMTLAHRVSVRDASSWRMTALVRRIRTVHLVDDPAMAIEAAPNEETLALLRAENVPFDLGSGKIVGISIKRLIAAPERSEPLTRALISTARWLVAQGYDLLFIPFCQDRDLWSERDTVYAEDIVLAIGADEHCHVVQHYYTPPQVAGIVGICQLVIGMRFHAQVFAHALGVPLVPIGYEEKRMDFITRYNYRAVPIDGITCDALIAAIERQRAEQPTPGDEASTRTAPRAEEHLYA